MNNRTRKPDPLDRKLVTGMADQLGVPETARRLGVTVVAVLNLVTGRGSYGSTLRRVHDALAELA